MKLIDVMRVLLKDAEIKCFDKGAILASGFVPLSAELRGFLENTYESNFRHGLTSDRPSATRGERNEQSGQRSDAFLAVVENPCCRVVFRGFPHDVQIRHIAHLASHS
jgi:hypothetical protein